MFKLLFITLLIPTTAMPMFIIDEIDSLLDKDKEAYNLPVGEPIYPTVQEKNKESVSKTSPAEGDTSPLYCGAFELNWDEILRQEALKNWLAHREERIFKTEYAKRFASLSDSSRIKQTCSKSDNTKEVNDACALLSNFLYCAHHPYNPKRPVECQTFCREYSATSPLLSKTLLALQQLLHLDPKESVEFMRSLSAAADAHKSVEMCSSRPSQPEPQKKKPVFVVEEDEILYC